MSHGLMQQDAGPAGTEHHGRFARRSFRRAQLHDRLPRGFLGELFGRFLLQEKVQRDAAASARVAVLRRSVFLARERENTHAGHGLAVEAHAAFAGRHHDVAEAVGIRRLNLKYARIVRARGGIGAAHQVGALLQTHFVGSVKHRIKIVLAGGSQIRSAPPSPDLWRSRPPRARPCESSPD